MASCIENVTESIRDLSTHSVFDVKSHGVTHQWALWRGPILNVVNGQLQQEMSVIVSSQPPPLPSSVRFENIVLKHEHDVLLEAMIDGEVAAILVQDNQAILQILKECVASGLLATHVLQTVNVGSLTPTRSPSKKKLKITERKEPPKAKTNLFGAHSHAASSTAGDDGNADNVTATTDIHSATSMNAASSHITAGCEEPTRQSVVKKKTFLRAVLVRFMPDGTSLIDLSEFLNRKAHQYGLTLEGEDAVIGGGFNTDIGEWEIEFCSSYVARRMSTSRFSGAYSDLILNQQVTFTDIPAMSSSCVKVSNLPGFFYEPHFKDFLDEYGCNSKIVEEITSYSKQHNTCIVKFTSSENAWKVLQKGTHMYERKELSMVQEEIVHSCTVLISNLPSPLHLPHFQHELNDTAWLFEMAEEGEGVVKSMTHNQDSNTCSVEMCSADLALDMSQLSPFVYSRKKINITLQNTTTTSLQDVSNIDLNSASAQQKTKQNTPPLHDMAQVDQKCASVQQDGTTLPDHDVISKSRAKDGKKAFGKGTAHWNRLNTDTFLRVYSTYRTHEKSKQGEMWDKIAAHMWVYDDLDYSATQLKDKLRGMNTYFTGTVMNSDAGKNGTSKYPHYRQMLNLHPTLKSEVESRAPARLGATPQRQHQSVESGLGSADIPLSRKCSSSSKTFHETPAAMDTWDKPAVLLLLQSYKERQGLVQ